MTRRRRTYRLPDEQLRHLSGTRVGFTGTCAVCDEPYLTDDRVVPGRRGWVHVRCASGGDDE